MSQVETNRRGSETLTTLLSDRRKRDPSQVFGNRSSAPELALEESEFAVEDSAFAVEENDPFLEAAQLCSQFLVRLSQDMRTPMSSILGITEIMLASEVSDSQQQFAATVAESVQALMAMADRIADFSRYLGSQQARLQAHQLASNGTGTGGLAHGSSNGSSASALAARASSSGVEDMLSKTPMAGPPSARFNGAANFTTRVPLATAKLIRILVAEDHLTNQLVMIRMLARLGYTADAVSNGAEAIAALNQSPYDIVLMDCQMPELDGFEATRQIRKNGGRFRSTPIIAVTANAMAGDREKCIASGMSDYMSKPVLAHTLATTLEKWILPEAATDAGRSALASDAQFASPQSGTQSDSPPALDRDPKTEPEAAGDAVDAAALAVLRSMDAGDEGFMSNIIDLFLTDLADRVEALRVAVKIRDGGGLKSVAHALKGSCGHFGAARLAALCRRMEQIGLQQPVGDASEILLQLEAEAGRVRIALEEARAISSSNSISREGSD